MKTTQERVQDPIERAKRVRTNAKCKFTRKCNAFMELSENGEQLFVLQDKFNDIRENFKELDGANDRLIDTINEIASHHVMDSMLEDCNAYMKEVESTLDKIRAIYASKISETSAGPAKSSQLHVKALEAPRFSGNIREYANFKQDFRRLMISAYGKDPYALRSCLGGPALQIIRGVEDDYDKIFERLDNVYGDSRKFIDSIIHDIKSIRPINDGDSKKFIAMVDVIERCWLDLKRMDLSEEMDTVAMVSMIEKLLPPVQKREWIIQVDSKNFTSKGMFEELLNYLLREKRVIEYTEHDLRADKSRVIHQTIMDQSNQPSSSSADSQPLINYVASEVQENRLNMRPLPNKRCWLHKTDGHCIEKCNQFLKMTLTEKLDAIRQFGVCFNCLQANRHIAKNCTAPSKCEIIEAGKICGRRHHSLLHRKHDLDHREQQSTEIYNIQNRKCRPFLAVNAIQCQNQRVNVMWDSGANISLITHLAAARLGLRGDKVTLSIIKVGNDSTSFPTEEYKVPLLDLAGETWTVSAYGIDEITANLQQVDIQDIKSRFPEVDAAKLRRPQGQIDMLIGVDSCTMMPTVVKTVGNCQLLENQFGYCIRGSFETTNIIDENATTTIRINHANIESHLDEIKI